MAKDVDYVNMINIIFFVLGIVLIGCARIPYGYTWGEPILDGVGCGCVSASIMSFAINMLQSRHEVEKILRLRKLYMQNYYDETIVLLQNIIWLCDRLEENNFDWDLAFKSHEKMEYLVCMHDKYKNTSICFEELEKIVLEIKEIYSYERVTILDQRRFNDLSKLVKIVYIQYNNLLIIEQRILTNSLILNETLKLDIEVQKKLTASSEIVRYILQSKDRKAYGVAFSLIFEKVKILRELCKYENDFNITLQGAVRFYHF